MAKQESSPSAGSRVATGVAVTQGVNAVIDAAKKRLQKRRNLTPRQREEALILHDETVMERTVTKCDKRGIREEKKVRRMIRRKFKRSRFARRYHMLMRFMDRQLVKLTGRMNMRKSQTRWQNRIKQHSAYISKVNKRLGDLEAVTVHAVNALPEVKTKEQKKLEKRTTAEVEVKEESTQPDGTVAPAAA